MKKLFSIFAISLLLLSSCGGIKTMSGGLENESFLEFLGNPSDYKGGVSVTIDDKTTFTAEVYKDKTTRVKGQVYAISTGTHTIAVSYNGKMLVKKQIFISAQETKKITLP
ncbi:MAG: hypothetical protein WCR72_18880 [Bacteroidota bacterium]